MQLLRRSDSNPRPNVRSVTGVPDHRVSKKQTDEGVKNVRTVTCQAFTQTRHYAVDKLEVRSKIGRFDTYCVMPSKLSTAYPTGGHVTQLEHHRRRQPVLSGAVVHR